MNERIFKIQDLIQDAISDDAPKGWVPSNAIERWVSWDLKKRYPLYRQWKVLAERRGITVIELLDKYNALEYLKRL